LEQVVLEELQVLPQLDQQVKIQFLEELHLMVVVEAVVFTQIQVVLDKMEPMVHQVVEVQNLIPMLHLQQMVDQVILLRQVLHKVVMEVVVR
tara:strand:- start:186 stop:461 length:276 start_codon:yes stop_codon:yes gene_type:complete